MKIAIDSNAIEWFKREAEVTKGEYVRFTINYEEDVMNRPYYPGFTLKFIITPPYKIASSIEVDGIVFYIEVADTILFDNRVLFVSYNDKENDIAMTIE